MTKEHGFSVKTSRPSSQARGVVPENCPSCGQKLAGTSRNGKNWGVCWKSGGGCGYGIAQPESKGGA